MLVVKINDVKNLLHVEGGMPTWKFKKKVRLFSPPDRYLVAVKISIAPYISTVLFF